MPIRLLSAPEVHGDGIGIQIWLVVFRVETNQNVAQNDWPEHIANGFRAGLRCEESLM